MKRSIVLFTTLLGMCLNGIHLSGTAADASGKLAVNGMDIHRLATTSKGVVFGVGTIDAGIVRSTDDGTTWTATKPPGLDDFVRSLAATPDGALFASTPSRIYKSSDEGNSWREVTAGIPKNTQISSIVHTGGQVFALASPGLFRFSEHDGKWKSVNRNVALISLAVMPDKTMIAVDESQYLHRSTDQGRRWKTIRDVPDQYNYLVQSVIALDDHTLLAGLLVSGTLKSSDGGRQWVFKGQGLPRLAEGMVQALTVTRDGTVFMGINDKLYRSVDKGEAWTLSNRGLPQVGMATDAASRIVGPQAWTVAESGNGTVLLGGRTGIFKSIDRGQHWSPALKINIDPGVGAPR